MSKREAFRNVEEYIESFPEPIRTRLNQVRSTVLENAPGAEEGISYGMPAYRMHGRPLVYFAGYGKHVGFYATPSGHSEFSGELSKYKQGKGSVRFPLDQPLPVDLIGRIVRFRAMENEAIKNIKK